MKSLYDFDFEELGELLLQAQVNPIHAKTLWRMMHYEAVADLSTILERCSPPLRRWVEHYVLEQQEYVLDVPEMVMEVPSSDGLTRKYLLKLQDGHQIETVLMEYDKRFTVCVSTQVGCAMGCVFCATGQGGFFRHLRVGEIVAQVQHVRRVLQQSHPNRRLRNLVCMGMGEPLHNYDAVMKAMNIISDVRGASLGKNNIAISTVGVVPSILKMAQEERPYRLAVSLHGSNEEERSALVPVSKKWSLEALIQACRDYSSMTQKRIFFEWTLIAGKNDSAETAMRLAQLLKGIDSHVNLIPLNPTHGFSGENSQSGFAFQSVLRAQGIPCTFRQRRGIDVAAGCGMLKSSKIKP